MHSLTGHSAVLAVRPMNGLYRASDSTMTGGVVKKLPIGRHALPGSFRGPSVDPPAPVLLVSINWAVSP